MNYIVFLHGDKVFSPKFFFVYMDRMRFCKYFWWSGAVANMRGLLVILTFLSLTECRTHVGNTSTHVVHADNTCMSDFNDCVFQDENKLNGIVTTIEEDDDNEVQIIEQGDKNSHIIRKRSIG